MSRVKINVPEGYGTSLTLTYEGDVHDPYTYSVGSDGTTMVEEEHVSKFLQAITGSSPASEAAEKVAAAQGVPGYESTAEHDPSGMANVLPGAASASEPTTPTGSTSGGTPAPKTGS